MRVLVTGACGWTAASIVEAVTEAGHEVDGFDLPDVPCNARTQARLSALMHGTIESAHDIDLAVRSVDAIIHLAVSIGRDAYRSPGEPFAVNVLGTYNIFASALHHGVSKVVLMSEAAVHLLPHGATLDARHDWRSAPDDDHLYDITKRLQEEIAKDFCETYGMTAVSLRAGHIVDGRARVDPEGRPLAEVVYCRGGWVCRYDLARACIKALELESAGYTAFHVIGSAGAHKHFDIERTERDLGLVCAERFEQYAY